jgi:hypothetical protein
LDIWISSAWFSLGFPKKEFSHTPLFLADKFLMADRHPLNPYLLTGAVRKEVMPFRWEIWRG